MAENNFRHLQIKRNQVFFNDRAAAIEKLESSDFLSTKKDGELVVARYYDVEGNVAVMAGHVYTVDGVNHIAINDNADLVEMISNLLKLVGVEANDTTITEYLGDTTYLTEGDTIVNVFHIIDDLIEKYHLTASTINAVEGEITSNEQGTTLTFSLSGSDMNVGVYEAVEYPEPFEAFNVEGENTVAQGFNNVEKTIAALTDRVLDDELVTEKAFEAFQDATGVGNSEGVIVYVKNGGATYINNATSLYDADDKLDKTLKETNDKLDDASDRLTITATSINEVDGEVVINDNGTSIHFEIEGKDMPLDSTYVPTVYNEAFDGAVPVKTSDNVSEAVKSVETTVSNLLDEVLDNELVTEKAFEAVQDATGIGDSEGNIVYVAHSGANYIKNAVSLHDADELLDDAIAALSAKTDGGLDDIYEKLTPSTHTDSEVITTSASTNSHKNIVRIHNNHIEAFADLHYDATTNTLKFVNTNGYNDIKLTGVNFISSITYDSTTEELKIAYQKPNETTATTVSVPLAGLIDEFNFNGSSETNATAATSTQHNVSLVETRVTNGKSQIYGELSVFDCGTY